MSEFKIVEEDEDQCKYKEKEIDALIDWMCNNIYTKQSPNAKDRIRKRDTNSELY